MSRVNRVDVQDNPAIKTIKWSSTDATLTYYDKDKKENVQLDLPFKFVVLEKNYVSFNGYDESRNTGFWSNEVSNKTDIVSVKSGNEVVKTFQKQEWKSVKDSPELDGCNYTQILYIAAKLPGDASEQIYRLMLSGASFGGGISKDKKTGIEDPGQEKDGWIRFVNKLSKNNRNAVYDNYITITGSKSKKNGAVAYTLAVFDSEPIAPEDTDKYNEMAGVVDAYFEWYNSQSQAKGAVMASETAASTPAGYDDDLPF